MNHDRWKNELRGSRKNELMDERYISYVQCFKDENDFKLQKI